MNNVINEAQKKPLKIAMIGHKRIPGREGGIEIVVQEISERLVERGHRVVAYNRSGHHIAGEEHESINYDNLKTYKGIDIIRIPTVDKAGVAAFIYSVLATIHALFGKFDVIMYHAEGPSIMCWLPKIFGIPVIAENHGLDWTRDKWGGIATKVLKAGEKMMAKKSDCLIVLSQNIQDYFLKIYDKNSFIVPNGVNRGEIKPRNEIIKKFNLDGEYFLSLSRLVPEKGIHYLIDSYKQLEKEVEKEKIPKLVIAGGISDTSDYMQILLKKADGDQNIIFTGFVQGDLLKELYSNAFLYILPSDVEGMPLSLLEAMSYGCCCLTSDINECVDVIGDNGFSFKQGNIHDLKDKIKYCINNRDVIEKMKLKAPDYICNRYNWDESVNKLENIIYEVIH